MPRQGFVNSFGPGHEHKSEFPWPSGANLSQSLFCYGAAFLTTHALCECPRLLLATLSDHVTGPDERTIVNNFGSPRVTCL